MPEAKQTAVFLGSQTPLANSFALSLPVRALAVCVPDSEAEAEGVRKGNKEDREDRAEHQTVIELKRLSEPKEPLKIISGILPVGILVSQ